MPDVNPYAENPYASPEEPKAVFPHGGRAGESGFLLTMPLLHGFFSRPCELSVTEDRMEISAAHLEEPVTIFRETAQRQVKLRLRDMVVRGNDGRKYHLVYRRDDRDKLLTLARLEAWMNPHLTEIDCLKKWTSAVVQMLLITLLALPPGMMLMLCIFFLAGQTNWETFAGIMVFLGWFSLLMAPNAIFLLLRFRKMWAHYLVIAMYSFICLIVILVSEKFIGIFFFGLIVYQSVKALRDYSCLCTRIRV